MYNSYVLRRGENGSYVFDLIRPEEAVYCTVFHKIVCDFKLTEYESLKERIEDVFSKLKEKEKEVLIYRFGFGDKFYSLKEISEKMSMSSGWVKQIERTALRELSRPSIKRKIDIFWNYNDFFHSVSHTIDFENIIIDEITNYLTSNNSQTVFWDKIIEKNNISLTFENEKNSDAKYGYNKIEKITLTPTSKIEELDLSVRTFGCLKRAGINIISELTDKSREDMKKIRNLGKKSFDEIMEKMQSLGFWTENIMENKKNDSVTIKFKINGKETICIKEMSSVRETAKFIFEILIKEYKESGIILDYNISTGLLLLLLLKGCIFVETIANEYEKICIDLQKAGYIEYADELNEIGEALGKYFEIQRKTAIRIIKVNSDIARNIICKKPCKIDELLKCCNCDDIEQAEYYKKLFQAEFDNHVNFSISDKLNEKVYEKI